MMTGDDFFNRSLGGAREYGGSDVEGAGVMLGSQAREADGKRPPQSVIDKMRLAHALGQENNNHS